MEGEHWRILRLRVRQAGVPCVGCGWHGPLNLHHTNYDFLGEEKARDLIPLCSYCHKRLHAYLDKRFVNLSKNAKVQQTTAVFQQVFPGQTLAQRLGEIGWKGVIEGKARKPKATPRKRKKAKWIGRNFTPRIVKFQRLSPYAESYVEPVHFTREALAKSQLPTRMRPEQAKKLGIKEERRPTRQAVPLVPPTAWKPTDYRAPRSAQG